MSSKFKHIRIIIKGSYTLSCKIKQNQINPINPINPINSINLKT